MSGNWVLSPLRDVLALCDSGVWGTEAGSEQDFPVLRSTNVQNAKLDLEEVAFRRGIKNPERFILRTGDIIVTKSSGSKQLIGKCCVFSEPRDGRKYLFSNFVQRLRTNNRMLPDFLFYFLNSSWGKRNLARLHETTSGLRNLDTNRYLQQEVPVPPIAVQQGIVAVLKQADTLRQKREQADQLTSKIIQSVFLKMFGDPVGNPKKWTTEKLGRLAVRITKGESPKWQGFEYVRDGVLFIRSENVLWGYLDLEEETRIPKEFHDKLERSQLRPRDVLINLVGASIGRAAMVPETIAEANINQAVGVITLGPELKPKFLVQFLISPSVQQIIQGGKVEAARANISLGDLRELDVVVPPIDLQDKFVEFTKKLEALRERQAQSEDETSALFHSLMHKAFRGELVS